MSERKWNEIKNIQMVDEFWPGKEKVPGETREGMFLGYKTIKENRILLLEREDGLLTGVNESAALKGLDDFIGKLIKIEFIEQTEFNGRPFNNMKAYSAEL